MMKKLVAVALMLVAGFVPALAAQTATSFTGKWEGTFTGVRPDGTEGTPNPAAFNLTQKGDELTGTAGPPDQQQPIVKGTVKDGKATFEVQRSNGGVYKFALSIVKGRLQGEMTNEADGSVRGRGKIDAARAK